MSWLDQVMLPRTALVLLDVQDELVSRFDADGQLVNRLVKARSAARDHEMMVIFVRVGLRGGYLDVSRRNLTFTAIQEAGDLQESSPQSRVADQLAPRPDEPVVLKRRTGAFSFTDLEVVLRSQDIEALVLCGMVTGGAVLSTLRVAADLDFRCAVLSDGCVDPDEEVHRVLVEKVFPRQAAVFTVDEFVNALSHRRPT